MSKTVTTKTWSLAVGGDGKRRSKPPGDTIAPTIPAAPVALAINSSTIRITWTASIDSQSGISHYIVERSPNGSTGWASVGTPAAVTFDDTSCASSTHYWYRIKAVDGSPAANTSAASSVVDATTSAGAALSWPVLTPTTYLPIIPGLAGWGMNTPAGSGRHLGTPATAVMVVDTLSNSRTTGTKTQSNPDVWTCSLPFAVRQTFPRTIVFKTSGVIDLQRGEAVIGRYCTIAGQTAPSPGIFIKNGHLITTADEFLAWHIQNYNGDQTTGQNAGERRGLDVGANAGGNNWVTAWCSFYWSSDQQWTAYGGGSNFTCCHCVIAESLHNSVNPKGAHGYSTLIENHCDNVTMYRNIFAHATSRNPLCRAPHALIANNIMYNAKGDSLQPTLTGSGGSQPQNYSGTLTQANWENNWFIKGPNYLANNNGSQQVFVQGATSTFALLTGSHLYFGGNHATGWTYATDLDLVGTGGTLPADLFSAGRISSAYPEAMQLINPRATGYLTLCKNTIGARPGDRAAGRDGTIWGHVENKIAGTTPVGACIDSPSEVGYLSITPTTRDLFNSGAMSGDPIPNGSDRDTVQVSGYTKLEEWLYRQHQAVI